MSKPLLLTLKEKMEKEKIKEIYSNENGSYSTVTLSESSGNFDYLEIFVKDSSSRISSQKIYKSNNKIVNFTAYTTGYMKACNLQIVGNQIKFLNNSQYDFGSKNGLDGNYLAICKVVGCKK